MRKEKRWLNIAKGFLLASGFLLLPASVALAQAGSGSGGSPPGGSPGGPQVRWSLYAQECPQSQAARVVPCGSRGYYYLGETGLSQCTRLAGSTQPIPGFSTETREELFPNPSLSIEQRLLQSLGDPWVAIIDTGSEHAESVSWLVDEVSGSCSNTALTRMSSPTYGDLGSDLSEFHLMAALCPIVATIENSPAIAPVAINMSFGRDVQETDPANASCDADDFTCQIAKVLDELHQDGVAIVAAAGNQRDPLFPASLDFVTAVGMSDVREWLDDQDKSAAWETPTSTTSLFPGQSLCLDDWAASAGSSYAAAVFSGLLSCALEDDPTLDPLTGGGWGLGWDTGDACWKLERDGVTYADCSPGIDAIAAGLAGGYATECWNDGIMINPAQATLDWSPELPTAIGYSRFMPLIGPTPEADPCVPCVGDEPEENSDDMEVNTSASDALPPNTIVDSVYIRIEPLFSKLNLTAVQLADIASGTLTHITIDDVWSLANAPKAQPSLVFVLTEQTGPCLEGDRDCYWVSVPITTP